MSAAPTEGDRYRRFLDAASGLPPSPVTLAALPRALSAGWPDPSRRYDLAARSRDVLNEARRTVARILDCPPDGVVFAAGAAGAAALALTHAVEPRRRLLVSAIEDLAVLRLCDELAATGRAVRTLPVDPHGRIDPREVARLAADAPAAICVQAANKEIATTQDLVAIREAAGADPRLLVDASAVLGRAPLPRQWDVLWADPRTWGGPPGVSILATRRPHEMRPAAADPGGHLGVEPPDPPVGLIAAAAVSLEAAIATPDTDPAAMASLRHRVVAAIPDTEVLGHPVHRVGHITMFSFLYVAADELVQRLAGRGWSVSSGASCTSDTLRPHHVLVAIGASTHGSLRVSARPDTDAAELLEFADDLAAIVGEIRRESGVADL